VEPKPRKINNKFINQTARSVLPVCVRMCRLSRLGRSKALPQTSQGRRFRSFLAGLDFGVDFGTMAESIKSPVLLAPDDDCSDSPDIDLCSSSDGGDMGRRTRDNSDNDRSSGESIIMHENAGRERKKSYKHEETKVNSQPNKSKCSLDGALLRRSNTPE
jgi:hypothetical protein